MSEQVKCPWCGVPFNDWGDDIQFICGSMMARSWIGPWQSMKCRETERKQLKARVAELEVENARLKADLKYFEDRCGYTPQAAE